MDVRIIVLTVGGRVFIPAFSVAIAVQIEAIVDHTVAVTIKPIAVGLGFIFRGTAVDIDIDIDIFIALIRATTIRTIGSITGFVRIYLGFDARVQYRGVCPGIEPTTTLGTTGRDEQQTHQCGKRTFLVHG
jgi:hypothetical protein